MQTDKRCLATPRNAKDYLAKNEIPQLFECLMTGLMYHRPQSHIDYLQQCLDKIKAHGVNGVRWDMFLEAKTIPLPPISPADREEDNMESVLKTDNLQLNISYDVAMVIFISGPGMDKNSMASVLTKAYPRFCHVEMGRLLRERCQTEISKGVSKWKIAASLINSGELAPSDMVLETLIRELNYNVDVSGYIIQGYPRTQKELEDFERFIGMNRLNFVVLVDCEEDTCQQALIQRTPLEGWSDHNSNSIGRRIANYKAYTLPVCKYFDDQQKLRMVDGDKTKDEVLKDISKIFKLELSDFEEIEIAKAKRADDKHLHNIPLPGTVQVQDIEEIFNITPENKRLPELPQCPIVLLLGGPGSGKTSVATDICKRYQDWFHININDVIRHRIFDKGIHSENWNRLAILSLLNDVHLDANQLVVEHWNIQPNFIKEEMKKFKTSIKGIIIEGFPKDKIQLDQFNSEIGRADLVILLDCDEYYMLTRLLERNERLHRSDDDLVNIEKRINYYKACGLPVCRYYDERHVLKIVSGDRKQADVLKDIITLFELVIMKNRCIEIKSN